MRRIAPCWEASAKIEVRGGELTPQDGRDSSWATADMAKRPTAIMTDFILTVGFEDCSKKLFGMESCRG